MTSEKNLFYEEERAENKAIADAMARRWDIFVYYRTNSGCNTKLVTVVADTVNEAHMLASAKVKRMRGVIKIDGGEWANPDYRAGWEAWS